MFWNYEYGKIIATFEFEQAEPMCIQFIEGYGILVVGTSIGIIYFIKFNEDEEHMELQIIANINLIKSLIYREEKINNSKA